MGKINTSISIDEEVKDAIDLSAASQPGKANFSSELERIARRYFDQVGWPSVTYKKKKATAKS